MECKESNQGCHPTGWPAGNPKYLNTSLKPAWDLVGGLKQALERNARLGYRYTSERMYTPDPNFD